MPAKTTSKSSSSKNRASRQTPVTPTKAKPASDPFQDLKDDPEFQEFLNVQRDVAKKRKTYAWANDVADGDLGVEAGASEPQEPVEEEPSPKEKKAFVQSDLTLKLRELPYKVKKGDVKRWFHPIIAARVKLPGRIRGIAYVSFKTEADMNEALKKHKSILGGHQVLMSIHGKGADDQPVTKSELKPYHVITETVEDTGRLYVRNLSYTCTSQDLEDLFSPFGQLTEVYLPIDATTKKAKGFAFVQFVFPEQALAAMKELDKTKFQGRLLHILAGESKPDKYAHHNNLSTFKQKKEQALKEERQKASTWNTLFLGANAAADAVSAKHNVKKSTLVADRETKDSIAVRMALGETQIVSETKKFLLENGVNLSAFTEEEVRQGTNPNEVQVRKRSRTVLVVKNLAVGTDPGVIEQLFARFGFVTRVILPVHGATALVEMQEEVEAQKAFKALLNYRLKHVPIYLEWAPVDVFSSRKPGKRKQEEERDEASPADAVDSSVVGVTVAATGAEAKAGSGKLLVRNIPFEASSREVEQIFAAFPGLKSVRLPKKLATATPGSRSRGGGAAGSHRGFGFIEYSSRSAAEKAMESLSASTHLYGRRLVLEWAKEGDEDGTSDGARMRDSLNDKQRVIGSDGSGDAATKRFKKSNLNSSLRSTAAGTGVGARAVDPLDFDPLA